MSVQGLRSCFLICAVMALVWVLLGWWVVSV